MVTSHNLGFPRIGAHRELKFALEKYWKAGSSLEDLKTVGKEIRKTNWAVQNNLNLVPIGDFSFYDHVLDTSYLLNHLPKRVEGFDGNPLDNYFRVARGRSALNGEGESCCGEVAAGEMTKWFDTNYHYIVPEFHADTKFHLNPESLLNQLDEALDLGVKAKPVILGPVTYLALGKAKDGSDKLSLLPLLIPVYKKLLNLLASKGVEWVQIDEPILVTELEPEWQRAFDTVYNELVGSNTKILIATYFGGLGDNAEVISKLPVSGFHVDAINGMEDIAPLVNRLRGEQVFSVGVINGRNIWKTDLNGVLDWLEPIHKKLADRLWIAPSCSLIHVPVDLELETELDEEVKAWMAFAKQKLEELRVLTIALNEGRSSVAEELKANEMAIQSRRNSFRVNNPRVKDELNSISPDMGKRHNCYKDRVPVQAPLLRLPKFPTTTIGSFPQTKEIRQARSRFKSGLIDHESYQDLMRAEIRKCVKEQEAAGLDVLVHGEPERNDMVEYFGELLDGFIFSKYGWVQSYGSRCVKPPILFGDISRPRSMTVEWIKYAQSLTHKPMKGMLTGPVTILNWSFVRDDQPRSVTCKQIALAIREEVLDLEKAGIRIIQIDEAALREGLPLRKAQWKEYLDWAIESFRIAANGVSDKTQIHTHMCYSEFNDIIEAIADMDADVITIETSRSDMELLDVFDRFSYPNEIGPGVYDIHSPNIPTKELIIQLMRKAVERIPAERLWINPDCGLKTRQWNEVVPALTNMVSAAKHLRSSTE